MPRRGEDWIPVPGLPDCIRWWGHVNPNKGYGTVWIRPAGSAKKVRMAAHRFVWEQCFGPIAKGGMIHHVCSNRSCVNPAHLQLVANAKEHARVDPQIGARRFRTHCMRGHPYVPENTYAYKTYRMCKTCDVLNRKRREQLQWLDNGGVT